MILAAGNLVERISKLRAELPSRDTELKFLLGITDVGTSPENYFKAVVESESLHKVEANKVLELIQ
jgi:hypothetical protein